MADAAADPPDASEHVLNLGKVGQVRVRVAYGRMLEGPSHDVFLLDMVLPAVDEVFDELPYLEALEPLLYTGADETPVRYSVHLDRHHTSWGSADGEVEIRLNLTTGSASTSLPATALDAVIHSFRRLLEQAGTPERSVLRHDDAIARARALVEEAYPEVHSDALWVSDEEHRAAQGSWSVGLRRSDLHRYVVVVAFLDGHVGSAHVRHEPRGDAIDSIGSEVP